MTFLYVILLAIFLQVCEVESDLYRINKSRCDKLIRYILLVFEKNEQTDLKQIDLIVTVLLLSFRASRNVSYRESYRVSKWAIFYETKYRWKYRKEVNHLILREEFPFSSKLVD